MAWRKQSSPVDRSVRDLERQLAAVQRQIRTLTLATTTHRSTALPSWTGKIRHGLNQLLSSAGPTATRSPDRVVDAADQALHDWESEPIAFAMKHEPDLFTSATPPPDKLVHYLSAGSIKTYHPAKRGQREMRNRFLMWVGLSCLALWLIYVVVR